MRIAIPSKTRQLVAQRAEFRCEYCRIHEDDLFIIFEIDHIISLKHGGNNDISNLAYACPHCNQHKGTDLSTILENEEEFIPLFNPRKHLWQAHFEVEEGEILPLSIIGRASIKIFRFNQPDLLILQKILMQLGRYP